MFDVIVVGAGPAGSSAARRCGQLGLKTLLIDKAFFARDKLCGGAVSEYALSNLDFGLQNDLIEHEIYGVRVHFANHAVEVKRDHRLAVLVSRTTFDHYLLKKAEEVNVQIIQGKAVSALEQRTDCVEIKTGEDTYRSKIVIGCDGYNSFVARKLRQMDKKSQYGICMEAYPPASPEEIDQRVKNIIEIYFGYVNGGYGWVFPHREYFSVGIGGVASKLRNLKDVMRKFLMVTGFDDNVSAKGAPIPAGGFIRKTVANRLLLAGDAAGYVDTFSGEGIGYAIRSGQLAGETAFFASSQDDFSRHNLLRYKSECEKEFGNDLRHSLYLSWLIYRFPNAFFKMLTVDAGVLEKYLEVPLKRLSYQDFVLWLLLHLPVLMWRARKRE